MSLKIIYYNLGKFLHQFRNLLISLNFKLPIDVAIGEKRLVVKHLFEFSGGLHGRFFSRINSEIDKLFPDITDGLVGRMDHVFLVKAIVAKFIQKNLVSREIMGVFELFTNLIDGQQKRGFAQLIAVETVFQMP